MPATLSFDIGGTKIAYGWVDDAVPTEVFGEGRLPSQPPGSTVAEQLHVALELALADADTAPTRIAIGAPGIVLAPQGDIVSAGPTVPGWAGTDLRAIVAKHSDAPVACHNDVRMWAWGEHHLGAGQQLSGLVLYLALGTGVGGAIVDDGEIIGGPTGSAGEFSELVTADFRGYADRAENIAAGPSLARYYAVLSREPDSHQIPWTSPAACPVDLPEVIHRYRDGDELARNIIDGNLYGLGRTLGGVVSAFDISGIVLGGGVCGIGTLITDPLRRGIKDAALAPNRDIPVLDSALSGNAQLIAGASYAREHAL